MDNELLDRLDNIIRCIDDSKEAKEIEELKSKLLNDKELLKEIESVKSTDYGSDYINKKKDILDNEDFKRFKELENIFYMFSK